MLLLLLMAMVGRPCRPRREVATSTWWRGCWRARRPAMVVLRLLRGGRPFKPRREGGTPARGGGPLDVVERRRVAKAEVSDAVAGEYDGRTALRAAAGGGHLDVVERL